MSIEKDKSFQSLTKIMAFLFFAEKLKKQFRYTFTNGCTNPLLAERNPYKINPVLESVASHSWFCVLILITLYEEYSLDVDFIKTVKMMLIHDLGETIDGDVDLRLQLEGRISKKEKYDKEKQAWLKIVAENDLPLVREFYELWLELEEWESKEACLVKAIDRIEPLMHLIEASVRNYTHCDHLPGSADYEVKKFPVLCPVLLELKQRLKKKYLEAGIPWHSTYEQIL